MKKSRGSRGSFPPVAPCLLASSRPRPSRLRGSFRWLPRQSPLSRFPPCHSPLCRNRPPCPRSPEREPHARSVLPPPASDLWKRAGRPDTRERKQLRHCSSQSLDNELLPGFARWPRPRHLGAPGYRSPMQPSEPLGFLSLYADVHDATSLQNLQDLVVNLPVGADELPRIDRPLAAQIRRAASRFLHDNSQRRKIPRLRGQVHGNFRGALGDQHVLPEPANRAAISRHIGQQAQFRPHCWIFLVSSAGCEDHRLAERVHARNVNPLAVPVSAFPAISPPARTQSRSARHPGNNFAVHLDSDKRPKPRNPTGKLFSAIHRINNHPPSPRSARRLRIAAAHLFTQNVQREPASRYSCPGHLFHAAVGLRYRRAVALPFNSQLIRAEIPHRNRIRLLRDRLEQRPIRFPVSHSFSLFDVHHRAESPDLTLSSRTPSIQTYADVCSSQHRNRPPSH